MPDKLTEYTSILRNVVYNNDSGESQLLKNLDVSHGIAGVDSPLPDSVYCLNQVHGATIVSASESPCEADGIYTNKPKVRIGIKTADCTPVLIYNPNLTMGIHCGWRGISRGIIGEAMNILKDYNCTIADTIFLIGPAILPPNYQVSSDVVEAISKIFKNPELIALCLSADAQKEKAQLNLQRAVALRLSEFQVPSANIEIMNQCTFERDKQFHSYRRDPQNRGRNINWIQHR